MEQWKVDIAKSRVRSPKLNPPKMYLKVKMDDGTWEVIRPPYLVYAKNKNKNKEIGQIDVEIKAYGGDLYDYKKKGKWKNILNKVGREVELYEGWGNWVDRTFKGKISKCKDNKTGSSSLIINLTCANVLEEVKHVETLGTEYSEGTGLDTIATDMLNEAGFGDVSTVAPYETIQQPPPQVEKWLAFSKLPKEINYNALGGLVNGNIVNLSAINSIIFYDRSGYLQVYDYKLNSFRTSYYGVDKVKHDGGTDSTTEPYILNGGYLVPHLTEKKMFIIGRTHYSRVWILGGWNGKTTYSMGVSLFDFQLKRMTVYGSYNNPTGDEGEDARVLSSCWGADGNIYYISYH